MRLNKTVSLLLVTSLICGIGETPSYANQDTSTRDSQALHANLNEMCHKEELLNISPKPVKDSKGELARYFYIKIRDEDEPKKDARVFDCTAFGVGPMAENLYQSYKVDPASSGCSSCSMSVDFAKVIRLQEFSEEAVANSTCGKDEKIAMSNPGCLNQIGCNVARSLLGATPGISTILTSMAALNIKIKAPAGCDLTNQSNCLQEVAAGILKQIWDMVAGIGYLVKGAAVGAIDGVKYAGGKIYSWFSSKDVQAVEDKLSEASIVAGTQSHFSIQEFLKTPGSYIMKFIESFVTSQWDSIAEFTGCEKWSGIPHASKCLKHYENWRCATCNQRMNAVCGMVGAIGSDLIVAFFTGGAVNAIARSGKFAKAAEVITKIIKVGNESALIRKTVQGAVILGRPAIALGKGFFKAFELLNKIPPFKQWAYLNERAFLAGLEGRMATSPILENALSLSKDSKGTTAMAGTTNQVVAAPTEFGVGSKQLLDQSRGNPILKHQLDVAGDTAKEILRLPADQAKHIFGVVETFTPEELQIFKEEVKKPGWKWCR